MKSPLWSKILEWFSNLNSENLKTSLTLDYRKGAWGGERIVLDTISNHLFADSRATKVSVEYLQEGEWVDFRKKDDKKPIEKVRFKDNGNGFGFKLLEILYSTKTDDKQSIGQFGEGMKLVSSACLREGIAIEYHSRDWSAKPYAKDEKIEKKDIQRLCFKVNKNKPRIEGSETIFHNPNRSLTEIVDELPELVLAFNNEYKILSSFDIDSYISKIIDLNDEKNALFVKGIRIKKGGKEHFDSIFSYDLGIEDISPDRQFADELKIRENIEMLLQNCNNKEVHKRILMNANNDIDRNFEEYKALGYSLIYEKKRKQELAPADEVWKQIFYEVFGEKSVLVSGKMDDDKDASALGYNVVGLNKYLYAYMKNIGVESSTDLLQTNRVYKWIDKTDLLPKEVKILNFIPKINKIISGSDMEVNIGIYEGECAIRKSIDGHILREDELETTSGVYDHAKDLIGIKRTQLKTRSDFINTYLHELGHKVTGEGDYDRGFTEFFTKALTKLIDKRLSRNIVRK